MSRNLEFAREPSVSDTEISITDPVRRRRLELKLQEYAERAERRGLPYMDPDVVQRHHGVNMFKSLILQKVLEIADSRDTAIEPIRIDEVALAIQGETNQPVAAAVTVPYVYDPESDTRKPEYMVLKQNSPAAQFSQAYGIIQAYTSGREDVLHHSTGLPSYDVLEA
jgi:hypothetical protein